MSFAQIMEEQMREKEEAERLKQQNLNYENIEFDSDYQFALELQNELNSQEYNNDNNNNNYEQEQQQEEEVDPDLLLAIALQEEEQQRLKEEMLYKRRLHEGGSKISLCTPEQFHYQLQPDYHPAPNFKHHHMGKMTSTDLSNSPLEEIHPDIMQDGFIDRLEIGKGLESIFIQQMQNEINNPSYKEFTDEEYQAFLDEGTRHGRRKSRGSSLGTNDSSDNNTDDNDIILKNNSGNGANRRRKQRLKTGDLRDPKNGRILTKHDAQLAGRMNAIEMSQYEGAGDVGVDISIPHFAYNSLKRDLHRYRIKNVNHGNNSRDNNNISKDVTLNKQELVYIDNFTKEILQKMKRKGYINDINGLIKKGRKSLLYHGNGNGLSIALNQEFKKKNKKRNKNKFKEYNNNNNNNNNNETKDILIKIFKTNIPDTELIEWNKNDHINNDNENINNSINTNYKNKKRLNKQERRQIFRSKTQKEMNNLLRAKKFGIRCPMPIQVKDHILLLEFIGKNGVLAEPIHNITLGPKRWDRCYIQTLGLILKLYHSAHLIHCNFNEYNILYTNDECWIVGFEECINTNNIEAEYYLKQCINNMNTFFQSKNVQNIISTDLFYNFIINFQANQIPENHIKEYNNDINSNDNINEDSKNENNDDNNISNDNIISDNDNNNISNDNDDDDDDNNNNISNEDDEIEKNIQTLKKKSRLNKKLRKKQKKNKKNARRKEHKQKMNLCYYQSWEDAVVEKLRNEML